MLTFHRFDLPGDIKLSILPTKKLKTIQVKVYFPGNLDESVTRRALLPMVLRRGTARFPDMQSMQKHQEGLYGASVVSGVNKVGEWELTVFRLETVNDRFLPGGEDVFSEALAFLREYIFDPYLEKDALSPDYVELEKANLGRLIEGLIDSKDQYALERLVEGMCPDEEFRRYEYGNVEDLADIDSATLTQSWRDWSRTFPCEIYVTGDLDVERTRDQVAEAFRVERSGGYDLQDVPELRCVSGEPRTFREEMVVNQGKLCLGYRFGVNHVEGDLEAGVLMNGVLGSFSHSKLFQNVREKASLAYDVHSIFEKTKGLVFVVAGIAVENRDQAFEIIQKQVDALREGDISESELESTRESFDNHLHMLEDNIGNFMEIDFMWRLHGKDFEIEQYRDRLRGVTADRIVAAAEPLQLDSSFFLTSR